MNGWTNVRQSMQSSVPVFVFSPLFRCGFFPIILIIFLMFSKVNKITKTLASNLGVVLFESTDLYFMEMDAWKEKIISVAAEQFQGMACTFSGKNPQTV